MDSADGDAQALCAQLELSREAFEADEAARAEALMREVGLLDEPNFSEPVPEVNAAESDLVKQAERFLLPFATDASMPSQTSTTSPNPLHVAAPAQLPAPLLLDIPAPQSPSSPLIDGELPLSPEEPGQAEDAGQEPSFDVVPPLELRPPANGQPAAEAAMQESSQESPDGRSPPEIRRVHPAPPKARAQPQAKTQILHPAEEADAALLLLPPAERKRRRIELLTQAEDEALMKRQLHEKMACLAQAARGEKPEEHLELPFAGPDVQWDEEPPHTAANGAAFTDLVDSIEQEEPRAREDEQSRLLSELKAKLRGLKQHLEADKDYLPKLAFTVHKKVLSRGSPDKVSYPVLQVFSRAFCSPELKEGERRLVFYAFNELCRPLHKDPQSTRSKYVRHAAWQFMKSVTTVEMNDRERDFYVRFCRKHSRSSNDASWIYRAAGSSPTETKDYWDDLMSKWELAMRGRQSLQSVEQKKHDLDRFKRCSLTNAPYCPTPKNPCLWVGLLQEPTIQAPKQRSFACAAKLRTVSTTIASPDDELDALLHRVDGVERRLIRGPASDRLEGIASALSHAPARAAKVQGLVPNQTVVIGNYSPGWLSLTSFFCLWVSADLGVEISLHGCFQTQQTVREQSVAGRVHVMQPFMTSPGMEEFQHGLGVFLGYDGKEDVLSGPVAESWDEACVTMAYRKGSGVSGKAVTFPACRGSAFITAEFRSVRPVVSSDLMLAEPKKLLVDGKQVDCSDFVHGKEIEFTLSTGDSWLVVFPPGMGWVCKAWPFRLLAAKPTPPKGAAVQLAMLKGKNPGLDVQRWHSLVRHHAGAYPVASGLNFKVGLNADDAEVSFNWANYVRTVPGYPEKAAAERLVARRLEDIAENSRILLATPTVADMLETSLLRCGSKKMSLLGTSL
ncbi:unnamed protein product [Symbiodinium sp. CCMP2456]|nr:unnamed protein product [Symbiodinium sp. CCMP2456]